MAFMKTSLRTERNATLANLALNLVPSGHRTLRDKDAQRRLVLRSNFRFSKSEGLHWVESTNSPDEKAAVRNDFLPSGRYPVLC